MFNILSISKATKSRDVGQCLFCFTIPYGPACQDEQSNIQKTKPFRFKRNTATFFFMRSSLAGST